MRTTNPIKNKEEEVPLSKPYSQFNHPLKYTIDKFLSFIFAYVLPFDSIRHEPYFKAKSGVGGGDTLSSQSLLMMRMRRRMDRMESILYHISIIVLMYTICKRNDCLVGGTVLVPRQSNILTRWNIVAEEDILGICFKENEEEHKEKHNVNIEIVCMASSMINRNEPCQASVRRFGYQHTSIYDDQILANVEFKPKCPIIIYFHGGGMVFGSARDGSFILDYVRKLNCKEKGQNVILLSVEYRLAPESPFPNPIIDCLSAASFIIEKYSSNHDIHIAGFSAGGNLATVVGMECYRKYPGRIKR